MVENRFFRLRQILLGNLRREERLGAAGIVRRMAGREHRHDIPNAIGEAQLQVEIPQPLEILDREEVVGLDEQQNILSAVGILLFDQLELGIVDGPGTKDLANVAREADFRREVGQRQRNQDNEQKGRAREPQGEQPNLLKAKPSRHQAQSLPGLEMGCIADIAFPPKLDRPRRRPAQILESRPLSVH